VFPEFNLLLIEIKLNSIAGNFNHKCSYPVRVRSVDAIVLLGDEKDRILGKTFKDGDTDI
jgi:hypothetical protein